MALFNTGIPAVKDFSRDLKIVNGYRRKADYELDIPFKIEKGREILEFTHDSIAVFDAIDKIALSKEVEDYLRKTNQI